MAGKVPEDLVWHVLGSLADALCYLHYGFTTAREMLDVEEVEYGAGPHEFGWEPTAHRAVTMQSVYLTAEGMAGLESEYPSVLLGDFDNCIQKRDGKNLHKVVMGRTFQRRLLRTKNDVERW